MNSFKFLIYIVFASLLAPYFGVYYYINFVFFILFYFIILIILIFLINFQFIFGSFGKKLGQMLVYLDGRNETTIVKKNYGLPSRIGNIYQIYGNLILDSSPLTEYYRYLESRNEKLSILERSYTIMGNIVPKDVGYTISIINVILPTEYYIKDVINYLKMKYNLYSPPLSNMIKRNLDLISQIRVHGFKLVRISTWNNEEKKNYLKGLLSSIPNQVGSSGYILPLQDTDFLKLLFILGYDTFDIEVISPKLASSPH